MSPEDTALWTDAIFGEQHRGVDFAVPLGTVLMAPAMNTVMWNKPIVRQHVAELRDRITAK
jgi:hypothetical protein